MSAAALADAALEASVVGSFTRIGYAARRRLFDWEPLESLPLAGKTTRRDGRDVGLGLAAARADGSRRGDASASSAGTPSGPSGPGPS